MRFGVSVIIPVFNAESFVAKAVKSALDQEEVEEVLVINDGSTDKSLERLNYLRKDSRLKIYEHPGRKNLGRSVSRNLGIKNASKNFIAFLDADDFYLPNRFKKDKKIFGENSDADGVYNAIGAVYYTERTGMEGGAFNLTTMEENIKPEELFFRMWPKGYGGSFSGDGLTVKKSIFSTTGYFNENLKVAEDTDLWIKMSLVTKLYPGILDKPVSIRGIHENNVIHEIGKDLYIENYYIMYRNLLTWGSKKRVSLKALDYFWERLFQHHRLLSGSTSSTFDDLRLWFKTGMLIPQLFQTKRFISDFPFLKIIRQLN